LTTQSDSPDSNVEAHESGAFDRQAFVVFRLGDERYAASVSEVREVLPMAPATRVPRASAALVGVMNIRGQIMPILDLRTAFDVRSGIPRDETTVLIMTPAAGPPVGALVDSVEDVIRLDAEAIEAPPFGAFDGGREAFVVGVVQRADGLILVTDFTNLLTSSALNMAQR